MTVDLAQLRTRFGSACIAAGGRFSEAVFEALIERYREPLRYYHTLEHVDACLVWLDWYRGVARRPDLVELALWFHDAVYDPKASDNEAQSAALARAQLGALGVGSSSIDVVARFVDATRRHDTAKGDCALLIDLDLTILGASPHCYARFESQIRAEYAHVPERAFALGRAHVLRGFPSRAQVFQTPSLREQLEQRARDNLERRIEQLLGEGSACLDR